MAYNENQVTASIAAVGSQAQGINEINPRFTAEAQRNIRGFDCGVLDNTFYDAGRDALGIDRAANDNFMFPLTVAGTSISIGRGMATAYGYDFQSEVTNLLPVTDTDAGISRPGDSGGTIYYFVYLEWNLGDKPPRGYIKVHNNGSAGIWNTMQQDNLITTTAGVYQMPLYRIAMTASGDPQVRNWEDLNLAQTIHWPGVAETARYGETMAEGDQSDRVATTKFVQNATDANRKLVQDLIDDINTSLNFGNTTFYPLTGVGFPLKRLGGYVIGDMLASEYAKATWPQASTNIAIKSGTTFEKLIPEGYRPTSTHWAVLNRYELRHYQWLDTIGTFEWLTTSTDEVWRDPVVIEINSNGDVTFLDDVPTGGDYEDLGTSGGFARRYLYEPTETCQLDLGYTTNDKLTITVSAWNGYPVTTNITGDVYYQGPDYMEPGKTYTFTAKALSYGHYMKTCSLNAVGYGQVVTSNNGDGTWTVTTPTSSLFKGEYIITMKEGWIDTPDKENPLSSPVIPTGEHAFGSVIIYNSKSNIREGHELPISTEDLNALHITINFNYYKIYADGGECTVGIRAKSGYKITDVTISEEWYDDPDYFTQPISYTQDGDYFTFRPSDNYRYDPGQVLCFTIIVEEE